MARTKLHKQKGRWKNGFQEIITTKLQNYFDRRNYERDYFRALKKKTIEGIINKDTETQLKHL